MKLRQRFVLTLFVMAGLLIAPAIYGVFALYELRDVAEDLRTRDAVGALALGRLQAAFGQVEHWERIFVALASYPLSDRAESAQRVERGVAAVNAELERLREGGYAGVVTPAISAWDHLQQVIQREQQLISEGRVDAASEYREEVVAPAFAAMARTLDPIGTAINMTGRSQVRRAQAIAAGAATTALLALAVALAIALFVGYWLTRSVLNPIHQLRRGMAMVSDGDFDPDVPVDLDRPDEIGDLTRSFQRMTEQLATLDRLKAELISIASHELKTPLSVIRGYVSLLRDGVYGEVGDEQQRILSSVGDQTDRLGRMIQQLLDISRFEAGGGRLELHPVNLHGFLAELSVSFEALAYQNEIDFEVEEEPGIPESIIGDPDRLNEVLGNLLSNAFKFTPRGGRIRLRVRPEGDGVRMEVDDTGVGIPEDQLSRIFEKFYQVENEAQPRSAGSGLGLAISREIVEAHGGTITAESRVGEGTTFIVLLPHRPDTPDPVITPRPERV